MPIFAAFAVAAPEMLAMEAAAVTAAEIAAAEAAAAAAAEAAAVAAAEQAAATAAAETAAQAGIMEVGGATANTVNAANVANAATAPLTTAEGVNAAAQGAGIQSVPQFSAAELEALTQGQELARLSSAAPPLEVTASTAQGSMLNAPTELASRASIPTVEAGIPGDISNAAMRSGITDPSIANMPAPSDAMMRAGIDPSIPKAPTDAMMRGFTPNPNMPPPTAFTPPAAPPGPSYLQTPTVAPGSGPMPSFEYQLNAPSNTGQLRAGTSTSGINMPNTQITSVSQTPMAEPPSPLMKGLDSAIDWAKNNKFQAASGAYMGANALGLFKPSGNGGSVEEYDGPLNKFRISPDFQGSTANPSDFQYTPRYAMGGGVMGPDAYDIPVGYDEGGDVPEYRKGGSLSDSIEQYQKMLDGKPREALPVSRDVGIYYDQDPDTRYQDALTAAQIRQAKVNKRANVDLPSAKRPTPMGQLNLRPPGAKTEASASSLDPENAASGGIMHSSLGGYAAGGNPRLLRGPGDGMSDNIPATISGRQPARLADGEFVIPADVVSHLGNGSTEAGAKQLHAMMDKVRKARTGNPKQGKNIKPQKYMPKTRT
jgi:hypothetical protein